MPPGALERRGVSLAGYHHLDGRPGFKIAIQEIEGRWYLYLAHFWHSGWSILDVTDPTNPTLENYIEGPPNTTTKQIQVADGLMITGLEMPPDAGGPVDGPSYSRDRPYETGAYLWDIEADPTDPELVGHYETGGAGTHRNFYAGGDYAYMCASPEGFERSKLGDGPNPVKNFFLTVVDVSDPADPEEVARWMWPGQHPDDEEDREATYFHGPAYVVDDRAYLSYGRVGCVTLDVADPESPELVNRANPVPGFGGVVSVHSFIPVPGTDLAAVNTETVSEWSPLHPDGHPVSITFLLDISDEREPGFRGADWKGPRVVSTMPLPTPEPEAPYDSYYEKVGWFGPHNQHHPRGEPTRMRTSDYLFVTYFNAGFRVFDISDPLVPREAGYFVPEEPTERIGTSRPSPDDGLGSHLEDVVVDSRGYAYCTDPQQGLFVLDVELL